MFAFFTLRGLLLLFFVVALSFEAGELCGAVGAEALQGFGDDHCVDGAVEVSVFACLAHLEEEHQLRDFEPPEVVGNHLQDGFHNRVKLRLALYTCEFHEVADLDIQPAFGDVASVEQFDLPECWGVA